LCQSIEGAQIKASRRRRMLIETEVLSVRGIFVHSN
jgi:hypothetical protein